MAMSGYLLLPDQQQQNLTQNSPNLTAATKSEPNTTVCTLPLQQHQATTQQIVPTSSASIPMFHPTVTHNGISLTTTLRRKRKRMKKRVDRMPKICGMNCQNEKVYEQQQQMESDDLEEQVKRAKLAYYKSQIDLNYSLKSESVLRKRLLTLQIEQIQQEIESDDDDEQ
uniref:Uncharacterized protein n=1 Tax=Globodera pallida TaxID=36090 RepID=A0A183BJ54_GLOPA